MELKSNEQQAVDKGAAKAHESVDRGAEHARSAMGAAKDYYSEADRKLRERAEEGRRKGQDFLENVEDYVRDHPLTAIGLAFAVGTLLPMLRRR
jgi:ElaB/YqjD/DUF883 family membrane-anchored ribosome-binding protein